MLILLDFVHLVGLIFGCAVVVNDADAATELKKGRKKKKLLVK
jgi:hypothetical protein